MKEPSPLLITHIPQLKLCNRGKVRDIYELNDTLLIIATDRISAFDVVLQNGITYKGMVLTGLSEFWFKYTSDIAVLFHCGDCHNSGIRRTRILVC